MGLLDPSDWKGDNSIALWYGPGWSRNGSFASKVDQAVLLQLAGKTKKGESFSLHSDESWKCAESYSRNSGRFQPMDMGGEEVDGRRYCTYGDKKIVEDAYESGKYRIIAE
jgi:alpha-L-rhamnosidase